MAGVHRGVTADAAAPLLDVRQLSIHFGEPGDEVQATRDVSFAIRPGERVGLVGESGCGKTVTGLSLLGLLPPGRSRVEGAVRFDGQDLLAQGARAWRRVRGAQIGMIFQEPMSALDPVFTIGQQIAETLKAHQRIDDRQARERAIAALAEVGIPAPERRVDDYPHQLSGGMRQRAMIAIALVCRPRLLIADEPTTALDVTIQAQIIDLLLALSERNGTALLFITHDLGVVAETCTRVLTMYAGEVVEDAPVGQALAAPQHPYTSGLLRSMPRLSERKSRLPSVPGRVPRLTEMPVGCRFAARCAHARDVCHELQPLRPAGAQRSVRCVRHDELDLPGAST
ncbi:ABC transporter ATP-binding protein [Verticiella sediminum]|uniref:ABC transporter ATP-binding protein n=2 Tax=Verticiella sediminum TaxID=1247510 RepID=A0A556AGA8_9BURK|nr:ABC transporter ATP-binding protein [Verticiella sediminum]